MFNFIGIVSDILLEEEPQGQGPASTVAPQGSINVSEFLNDLKANNNSTFKDLLNIYNSTFGSQEATVITELARYLQVVTAQKGYFAGKTLDNLGSYAFLSFYDAFITILDKITKNKAGFADLVEFINDSANLSFCNSVFDGISGRIKLTNSLQDYLPSQDLLIKAKNVLDNQTNKLSQTAIQSLGSDTVHSAIVKIIAKRIPILDRVTGLKGIVKPFNKSVITPILHQFKKYTGYKQGDAKKNPGGWLKDRLWPKKVPGDFSKMVEDISANNLLNVAVLAYEYYIYLLGTQGTPLNTQTSQTPLEPVNASLNRFSLYVNNILNEYDLTDASRILGGHNPAPSQQQNQTQTGRQLSTDPRNVRRRAQRAARRDAQQNNQQQNQQTTGLPAEQIEKISNQVGNGPDPDYTSFIDNGESRYLPEIKYNLSIIAKDPSKEARALYKALTEMAYFVRPRLSAAQRVGAVAGALGSLRVGMGPVN